MEHQNLDFYFAATAGSPIEPPEVYAPISHSVVTTVTESAVPAEAYTDFQSRAVEPVQNRTAQATGSTNAPSRVPKVQTVAPAPESAEIPHNPQPSATPPRSGARELTKEEREANRLARVAQAQAKKLGEQQQVRLRPQMAPRDSDPTPAKLPARLHRPESTPIRLRLDESHETDTEEGEEGEGSSANEEDRGAPAPTLHLLDLLTLPFRSFYRRCPNCRSEEVYAVNRLGHFIQSKADRAKVVQKLHCERCICAFVRPGQLFGAPMPRLRPPDNVLYE